MIISTLLHCLKCPNSHYKRWGDERCVSLSIYTSSSCDGLNAEDKNLQPVFFLILYPLIQVQNVVSLSLYILMVGPYIFTFLFYDN